MLIDTHCHLNILVKPQFDTLVTHTELEAITPIIQAAAQAEVHYIINVGTSLIESTNCITIAKRFPNVFASVGIHPNDATETWAHDLKKITQAVKDKEKNKIIAIGECGIDKHYKDYNLLRQQDVFKAQIELALEHNLPLIIHTRDAGDETLKCLETFKDSTLRGTIHCFSESLQFAYDAINLGFVLGIGGTVSYPKNDQLRTVVKTIDLSYIILETDAPFLPPQPLRGKQNSPATIKYIAEYIAELKNIPFSAIAEQTTKNVQRIFLIPF